MHKNGSKASVRKIKQNDIAMSVLQSVRYCLAEMGLATAACSAMRTVMDVDVFMKRFWKYGP